MLKPTDRRLLFELLRPPDDYRLSCAVGTTYSLDLLALLVTPLAFTLFDWETKEGHLAASPLALLESLRRYADKLTVFCQTAAIQPPNMARKLFGYLEECVVEVAAPRGGVFHPKLWALRFAPVGHPVNADWPIQYRLLLPSRNLTFDRSWDTMLALEGTLHPQDAERTENQSLVRFISRLPALAARPPAAATARQQTELISSELTRVAFEPPKGFTGVRFWPMGISARDVWPFARSLDRLLVVSPFVSDGCLTRLSENVETTLVSRAEEMMQLKPETLEQLTDRYTLDPAAEVDAQAMPHEAEPVELAADDIDDASAVAGVADAAQIETPLLSDNLSGLHAKLYVADEASQGRVWTGSANATDAAFGSNVEILVELVGPRETCGVDAVLGADEDGGLRNLLQPFVPHAEIELDEIEERLESLLDKTARAVASHDLRSRVTPTGHSEKELFDVSIEAAEPLPEDWQAATRVSCRPVTVGAAWQQNFLGTPLTATFRGIHFERLTSFILFRVEATVSGRSRAREFIVNLPLQNAPENRHERLLLALLRNSTALMRYLRLLLADDGWDAHESLSVLESFDTTASGSHSSDLGVLDLPLLEPMLMALTKAPDKLDRIAQLVMDLEKTPEGRALIPPEFYDAWAPIWEVRSSS